ncbi:MAG: alpha-galactosidase [Anaerolineae bacterium]|nr:alpha-galactosidase [Anaerolineae bacterium]
MRFSLTAAGELRLESDIVSLGRVQPVINGTVIDQLPAAISENRLTYRLPDQREFYLEWEVGGWLRYSMDAGTVDSLGLCFTGLENLRVYLCNGYYSWDKSTYEEAGTVKTGYAMTQLLPRFGAGSVVVGFDRHDRYQQTFTVENDRLIVQTLWDRKDGRPESERLVIFEHPAVENALREWAKIVAAAAPIPPRQTDPILGWCSWYNLYAYITEENILEHLRGVADVTRREHLPMRIFQIDDGFTPEMGDWLEVKPQFPHGMKALLEVIRSAGFIPGLWIGPFMVGNRSHLYQEHPDWVVQDRLTGRPLVQMHFYEEFRWHKRSEEYYILDTTHPDALDYLRQVFHVWRWEWGCEYFKTDFMHFGSEHGPDRAVWHTPGLSRIEIWRRTAEVIREAIGDALWLGCGCPLWASVGLVDGVRIGNDVGVRWRGELSAQSLLRNLATRNFASGILWLSDPDCILMRERFHHLSEAELRSLALYAGMSGGVLTTSDALNELSPERLQLWKTILDPTPAVCEFPLLGQSDPVLVQVRRSARGLRVFILNTSDEPAQRRYPLSVLGLAAPMTVYDWIADRTWEQPADQLSVTLAPHDGALFFLEPS